MKSPRYVLEFILMVLSLGIFSSEMSAQTSCNAAKLKGEYGFAGTGFLPQRTSGGSAGFDPMMQIAAVSYDGNGVVSLKTRVQYHGVVSQLATIRGKYIVENDCTGTATFEDGGSVVYAWAFVIVHGGDEIETLAVIEARQTRPMYSMTFHQKKI